MDLVRGRFWTVLLVLGPIELVGDALTDLLTGLVHHHLGHSLLGIWAAESLSNVVLTPVYAVAAVLLTLDLIAEKDGAAAAATLGPGSRMISASIFSDFWNQLVEHDEQGLFLVLTGFILSFAFIRMSTRLMRSDRVPWWPGSVVSDGGVHLHHLVFGIVTMMIAGTLGFVALGHSPYAEICAFLFGVGSGLTIDEFALWVYLDDVYWAEQGRSSIDATVIAAAGMLLLLLGFSPLSFDTGSFGAVAGSIVAALILFGLVAICFAKQRILHGAIGFFIFPIAIYGAARIGKPGSPWARRWYGERRPGEAGQGRRALPARPPHRALQERLPRHRRRQAERGGRGRQGGDPRRHPRGHRRSAPPRRTGRPRRRALGPRRLSATRSPRRDGRGPGCGRGPARPASAGTSSSRPAASSAPGP